MQEVVESIRRVTDIMAEISAASQEQTAGIEQVNQAIAQMDQMTQQNASLVEESATASEAMREQAYRLTEVVGVFKINGTAGVPSTRSNVVSLAPRQAPATRSTANPLQAMRLASAGSARSGDWDEF
jgi:methyl-accepting chemotaxis protein